MAFADQSWGGGYKDSEPLLSPVPPHILTMREERISAGCNAIVTEQSRLLSVLPRNLCRFASKWCPVEPCPTQEACIEGAS
jgi:hypothetical protein